MGDFPSMRASRPPSRLLILGHPVSHSLSPEMHNAALAHFGITTRYDRLDVRPDQFGELLRELATHNAGGNVTIPHKEAMAESADCTPVARRVGAVNTFWHEDGRLIGHNTDVAGAMATIRALCPDVRRRGQCAVLGAGGAAAAVLVALADLEYTEITVASRTRARAERLVDRIGVSAHIADSARQACQGAQLVINTTPLGVNDLAMPVLPEALEPSAVAFDLVYRRGETEWVRQCRALGHLSVDGLPMLIEQGAAAFECWFGVRPSGDVLRRGLAAPG